MKKTLSIKDVEVDNIDYIMSFKGEGETAADALTNLILLVKKTAIIETESNSRLERISELLEANKTLTLEVEELNNRKPEIKEVEKQIEVEKKLEPRQFVCELTEENFTNARKCRKFIVQDKLTETGEPNEIANAAIKYFLDKKFPHIIDPLIR